MITDFILEKLPRFFGFLYRLLCESAVYRAAGRVWRAICSAFSSSVVGRALGEHENEGETAGNCLMMRLIDGFGRGLVFVLRKVVGWLTFGTYSCVATRLLEGLRGLYTFLDYEFFMGVCLWFIILCPGEKWSNVYGLAISIVLLGVLLLLMAADKRSYVTLKTAGAAFFAFVISTVAAIFTASNRSDAVRVFVFFATSFIMAITVAATATDKKRLKKILGFIFTAVIATSIYAFYQRAVGVYVSASLTDLTVNASMPGRVFSTFENPNNYAEFLVLTMPFCVAYCAMLKKSATAVFAWLLNLLPFAALLMTYSRSCWVSFAIAAVIFLFFYNKKLLPVLLIVALIAIPLLPSTVMARIGTIGSTEDSSNQYRLYIWDGVERMLKKDANWFTGVGLGPASFRDVYLPLCHPKAEPAPHSHMLFLEIWVEAGLFGVLTYFAMLFSVIRRSLIALKYASREVRLTLIAGISALGGIMFACTAEYIWFYPRIMVIYFVVIGLLYACIGIVRRERDGVMSIDD